MNEQIDSNRDAGSNGLFDIALAAGAIFLGAGAIKGITKRMGKGVEKATLSAVGKEAENVAGKEAENVAGNVVNREISTAEADLRTRVANMSKEDYFKIQDIADETGFTGISRTGDQEEAKFTADMIFYYAKGDMNTIKSVMKEASVVPSTQEVTHQINQLKQARKGMTPKGVAEHRKFMEEKSQMDELKQTRKNMNRGEIAEHRKFLYEPTVPVP